MEVWYFNYYEESGVVELRARMEGTPRAPDEGMVGDARAVMRSGDVYCGLSFDDLARARAGSVEVVNGVASIIQRK